MRTFCALATALLLVASALAAEAPPASVVDMLEKLLKATETNDLEAFEGKLDFKTPGIPEMKATLSVRGGKVAGFFIH